MTDNQVIFNLDDSSNIYKGVLFAEVDNGEIDKEMGGFPPTPKDYCAGVMAIIWTDQDGFWQMKMRIVFPSRNKQVISKTYSKDSNETLVLQDIYKFPIIRKIWTKNPDGTAMGIVKIIKDLDMVETMRIVKA